ncbi:hypothetical protein BKA63DRAFT_572352 [Paraphoma chrysanthemicola]|nr:hypothetical protein BKA63DRAFT_572352 [Paraphoma chrysanthemicola]
MSLLEFFALVALIGFLVAGAYACRLELRIQHLLDLLAVANSLHASAHPATNTLGDFEALQDRLKTSQDDNCRLRATIHDLNAKDQRLENLLAAERGSRRSRVSEGQQTVVELSSHLKRLQGSLAEKSASLHSLSAAHDALRRSADLDRVEMDRLQRTISDQATSLWQRDVIVARFNTVTEFIHQMVAAGGLQMVVTVLFLGLFAYYGGYDLGELGIDTQKFESYFERLQTFWDPIPAHRSKKAANVPAVSATATTTTTTTATKPAAAAPLAGPIPAPPSQPAKAETKNLAFQPSKKPGSFGVQK